MKHGYELPDYLNSNMPMVYIIGQKRLIVSNFKKILLYRPKEIVLIAGAFSLRILGEHLNIDYFNKDEICIQGKIQSISYSNN